MTFQLAWRGRGCGIADLKPQQASLHFTAHLFTLIQTFSNHGPLFNETD